MTKDCIENIILKGKYESCTVGELADRILLALENERVKEVVLWEGLAKSGEAEFMMRQSHGDNPSVCLFPIEYAKVKGKRGVLIFREQEGK